MLTEEPEALKLAAYCDPEDAFERACSRELRKLWIEKCDLLEALKYHQEQTRPIQSTIDIIKRLTVKE